MDPMFTDDLANPKCWMQKIPTWYGPDFFPDQRASGQPSKYVIGDGRRHLPVPDHRPGPEQCRGLGRHAHGSRRPARSSCRRRVPRHAGRHPEAGSPPAAPSRPTPPPLPTGMPAPTSSRSRPRSRTPPRASASTRPTSCRARSAPEPSGPRWTIGSTRVAPIRMPF